VALDIRGAAVPEVFSISFGNFVVAV